MRSKSSRLTLVVQLTIFCLLVGLIPYVRSFTVYSDYCSEAHAKSDPLYLLRALLIAFGLLSAVIGVCVGCVRLLFQTDDHEVWSYIRSLLSNYTLTLAIVAIGWAFFPFWVNGFYQAFLGNGPGCALSAYDPKFNMPMTVLGEGWRLPIIFHLLPFLKTAPLLVPMTFVVSFKSRDWLDCLATSSAVMVLLYLTVFEAPDYWVWLFD